MWGRQARHTLCYTGAQHVHTDAIHSQIHTRAHTQRKMSNKNIDNWT